ncbi:multimerin-2 [Bufo gargarizans]|uniref:multimerin-2 n=1 Tax=Bufo gargarizans TaxID=30331 RepID=UPI001CF2314E|nr:multimerin-2 [Bufo gargarizans]
MAEKLYVTICCLGLMILASCTLVRTHIYSAGSSAVGSIFEVHGISTFDHGLPGQEESIKNGNNIHPKHEQKPKPISSDTKGTQSPEIEHPKPKTGKWCPVVRKRIVTYVDVCKTEKYVIRSQQPCPHGTADCQKTMYRIAQKPIYELKRKFVTSLEWKCCTGYTGSTCEYADPNAIHIPLDHISSSEKTEESLLSAEVTEIIKAVESQENLLEDIQNDIHEAASHLQDLENALGNNSTIALGISQNQSEIDDRVVREIVLPHIENFLKAHFSPIWNSFNKSLQNLNGMVKNLSESVEINRRTLDIFLENSVPKKDLYELGTKFESKIQENFDKLEQLKQQIDNNFHTQQTVIHHNLTMIKADADVKLKRNLKFQQSQYSYLNFSIGELRRGQEQHQDDLLDLAQNITLLCSPRHVELSSTANYQVNETLIEHETQIKDLLTESEAAFENINILEKWLKELRTEFKQNSEKVQMQFMEKSLIVEEIKDLIQRQIMELNYTVNSIQNSSDELFDNCDCHKMNLDIIALEEIQRNFSNQFRDVLYGIEDVKQKEGSSKTYLQHSVEDLAQALQFNRQSLAAQQEQGRKLMLITSQLQIQIKNLTEDVRHIRMDNGQIHKHIKHLDSSFSSLLEDATRHERVLEALLGEEALELLSEDNPEAVYMTVIKMHEVLNNTLHVLEKQLLNTDSLSERLQFLEMHYGNQNSPDSPAIFNVEQHNEGRTLDRSLRSGSLEHMEPNHEASRDHDANEFEHNDIMILKRDLQYLYAKVNELQSSLSNSTHSKNDTIRDALKPFNTSIISIKLDIENLRELYNEHIQLFHKVFGNYEALISSDVPLDIEKLKSFIDKKMKKRQKGLETQNKKQNKKHSEEHWQSDETGSPHQDPLVAFSAIFTTGAEGAKMIRFNDIDLNYGDAFSSDGHFTAPYTGVYAFSISVDFGVGNGLGYLVFNGRHSISLENSNTEPAEGLKHQFAVVELKKNEKVWFELFQGSIKKNTKKTSLSGYLVFKT